MTSPTTTSARFDTSSMLQRRVAVDADRHPAGPRPLADGARGRVAVDDAAAPAPRATPTGPMTRPTTPFGAITAMSAWTPSACRG